MREHRGLMMAKGLASNGAKVYIGGRRKDVVEKAAAEHGSKISGELVPAGRVGATSGFLSDPNAPECSDTETLGKALFYNESFEGWSTAFSVNVSSVFFVSTAFLGLLENASKAREAETGGWSSSIINITSGCGQAKLAQRHFAYNASKAAGIHLTKMLSTELALRSIPVRVNSIVPGAFPSEMTGSESESLRNNSSSFCTGRIKDIVGIVLYLVSPASYYVNGQALAVDGGFLAVNPAVV
ncbi:Enoyl-(Acyl carrier protein) reductase [Rhizoctonia solani]|uniref:Enoyl-(Acyl carrier protein) reductase n=1 Tax=Rhizoctonia solani TaxID=456999 RepID=A0A8H8NZE8_9AGAM|nr:Enoyl-(Acyl carrier protein) reductase [Rhizoctonia solani]QRW22759.1 Enoyl-(Acyl carrier protein) reductase [Rhizoctonia solani]